LPKHLVCNGPGGVRGPWLRYRVLPLEGDSSLEGYRHVPLQRSFILEIKEDIQLNFVLGKKKKTTALRFIFLIYTMLGVGVVGTKV
jgi:hypothetical protein